MSEQPLFYVHKSGIYTSLQDLGRHGYQQFGVPVSGAMDRYALQLANILVGNKRNMACLEVTLVGPTLEALRELNIAITGADLQPKINSTAVPLYTTLTMKKGDTLSFGGYRNGVRSYIAIAGKYDSPSFFGSQSVDMQTGLGHILEKEETIYGSVRKLKNRISLSPELQPVYQQSIQVGVIEGPHLHCFSNETREAFFNQTHTIGANSNRMGYRLESSPIKIMKHADNWTDAVPFGGIQVPPNGQPIILMADRQTTGGYPRIGTVMITDLAKIAQLMPKGKVRFYPISIEEAQQRLITIEKQLHQLAIFRKGLA